MSHAVAPLRMRRTGRVACACSPSSASPCRAPPSSSPPGRGGHLNPPSPLCSSVPQILLSSPLSSLFQHSLLPPSTPVPGICQGFKRCFRSSTALLLPPLSSRVRDRKRTRIFTPKKDASTDDRRFTTFAEPSARPLVIEAPRTVSLGGCQAERSAREAAGGRDEHHRREGASG